jgi:hypothetical protein
MARIGQTTNADDTFEHLLDLFIAGLASGR